MNSKIRLIPKKREQLSDYISAIAWSPQTHLLASCSAAGELCLSSLEGNSIALHQGGERALSCVEFSAQGEFLATAGQAGTLEVWNLQTDPPVLVWEKKYPLSWLDTLQWHPQKPILAYAVGREVYILDLEQKVIIATVPFENSSIFDLSWHPHQDYLAVSGSGGIKVWQLQHLNQSPYELEVPGASLTVAWSKEGNYLASGNLDRTLSILAWENPPPWLMQGFPGKVRKLAWSNSSPTHSPQMAAACMEGIILWRQDKNGDQWQNTVLETHQGFVRDLSFHPSKPFLASAGDDGRIILWNDEKPLKTLKTKIGGFSSLQWHNQGNYLAAGTSHGEVLIWECISEANIKKGFG